MKKRKEVPTLGNILRLFALQLNTYKGESRRSYQKSFTSFQLFVAGNYSLEDFLTEEVIKNWLVNNYLQGLTAKTVSFYLDKISGLYSGVAIKLDGGKAIDFKQIKRIFKPDILTLQNASVVERYSEKFRNLLINIKNTNKYEVLTKQVLSFPLSENHEAKDSIKFLWACLALKAGVLPSTVRAIVGDDLKKLNILEIFDPKHISITDRKEASKTVENSLYGEDMQWFALRLRPRVKFEELINRFGLLAPEIKMPELFYPSQEITKRVGRKVVWKDKPIIHDVVFFKKRKSEIYYMITRLYDLAWCYRSPGSKPGNYASIPEKAMNDFRKSLGFLTPDYEVAPAGEMEFKPGDKVIVINGEYMDEQATILKKPTFDEDGKKIFRVSLLRGNGHWDIGIDARLIKKI